MRRLSSTLALGSHSNLNSTESSIHVMSWVLMASICLKEIHECLMFGLALPNLKSPLGFTIIYSLSRVHSSTAAVRIRTEFGKNVLIRILKKKNDANSFLFNTTSRFQSCGSAAFGRIPCACIAMCQEVRAYACKYTS